MEEHRSSTIACVDVSVTVLFFHDGGVNPPHNLRPGGVGDRISSGMGDPKEFLTPSSVALGVAETHKLFHHVKVPITVETAHTSPCTPISLLHNMLRHVHDAQKNCVVRCKENEKRLYSNRRLSYIRIHLRQLEFIHWYNYSNLPLHTPPPHLTLL